MKLSNENIEEYILLLADNELAEAEEIEVMAFIEQHAAYKPMLDAYMATRLDNAEAYLFPDKESLLQPEPVILPLQKKSGFNTLKMAAAVTVLLGISAAFVMMFSDKKAPYIPGEKLAVQQPKVNTTAVAGTANIDTVSGIALVKKKPQAKQQQYKGQHTNAIHQQPVFAAVQGLAVAKESVPAPLENVALKKVAVAMEVEENMIVMIEQKREIKEEQSLREWLPVNSENLQGVNDLIGRIQVLKENIQEKTQSLKNTAFVINIGNRQFSIGK